MKINPLPLQGAAEIETAPIKDQRGWFTRFFCQNELAELNSGRPIQQINSSYTVRRGTLRGLHFQYPPHAEDKIVRCIQGKIFDVILDLRNTSSTYGQWSSVVLDSEKMNMLYIPKGLAHGFQTLCDNCQILYCHTEFHAPDFEGGIYYDSPELKIAWPLPAVDLSDRDKSLKIFDHTFEGISL